MLCVQHFADDPACGPVWAEPYGYNLSSKGYQNANYAATRPREFRTGVIPRRA
jgi:hypothetical protein